MANIRGLAYQWAVKEFGAGVRLIQVIGLAGAAVPIANNPLQNDPDRVFWILENRSPYHIDVSWQQSWTYGQGLLLAPNGGWVSMDVHEDGDAVTYPVWYQTPIVGAPVFRLTVVRA